MVAFEPSSQDYQTTAVNGAQNTLPAHANNNNMADNTFEGLRRYATDGSVMIPMEALEKLYLSPPTKVQGHLRNTFGNPTPM